MLDYDIESGKYLNPNISGDLCPKYVRHRGNAFKGGKAGSYLTGIIDLYDKEDHRIANYSGHLIASLSYKNNSNYSIHEQDNTHNENVYINVNSDGSYTLSYLVKKAGIWELSVITEGFEHIQGSPFEVEITFGDVSPDKSFLTALEQVGYVSNYRDFIVESRDYYGNDITEGGTEFVASILGGGKIINLTDLKNGKYRILCYLDETSPLSLLKVTLFGKDVLHSPFDLTRFYILEFLEPEQPLGINYLDRWMGVFDRNAELVNSLYRMREALAAKQYEVEKLYQSNRLGVVHSLPVAFDFGEDQTAELERITRERFEQYRQLGEQMAEINANIQGLLDCKDGVSDYIIDKIKQMTRLHNRAVSQLNRNTAQILQMSRLAKKQQELRRCLYEADPEAIEQFDKERELELAIRALMYAEEREDEESSESEPEPEPEVEERPVRHHQTKPDRPNSLAYRLIEGRYRPKSSPDS